MNSIEFINKYRSYRLNILVNIMNEIDSMKIYEMSVDNKINREAIIRAIDEVLELSTNEDETIRNITRNLEKLKCIFLEGGYAYDSLVNS